MSLFIQEFQMGINTKIALRILVKVLCVNCQLSTKRYVHFHTYVFKLKENGNGTFPSKVVSKPSRGNFKVNLTVNVQSLVTLGIKNRLCRDNNRESDSKSIKDWYASDETNMVVKTKNDDQLNHMTDYDWLTASRIKGLTFIHMVFYVSIHFYSFKNSLDSTKSRENPIQKNCNEKLGESFACQLSTKRYLHFIQYALQKLLQSDDQLPKIDNLIGFLLTWPNWIWMKMEHFHQKSYPSLPEEKLKRIWLWMSNHWWY